MKRITLSLIALLVCCFSMIAQQRSESEAMQIAHKFFGEKGQAPKLSVVPTQKVNTQVRKRVGSTRRTPAKNASFYVINDEVNNRFVIVSADERMYQILGYSDNGCFDPENAPEGLIELMAGYDIEYDYVINNLNTFSMLSSKKESVNPVLPLIKTKWGQGTPFNLYCPLSSSGSKSASGCVATAMAQILNYYGHPSQGQGGQEKYTTNSTRTWQCINYDTLTIDWTNIKDTYFYCYDNGKIQHAPERTDEENNEVAKLMHACGVSVFMDYNTGSGAFPSDVPYALIKHFGYNPNIICVRRECYSNEEWNAMIMEELNAQRPIIYGGQDGEFGGHEFIIDGINDDGLYHFNFGWYGEDDGYFSIDAIDPDKYKFHLDHDMVIRATPNYVEGEKDNIYFNQFSLKSTANVGDSYKINLSFKLYSNQINSHNFNFDGNVGVGVFDKDWNLINKLYEFDADNLGFYNKQLMQPQKVYWPDSYDDSGLLTYYINFSESIFGADGAQLYIAPYAVVNSTVVRGRTLNGDKDWYRTTTQNGKIIFEPKKVIEDPEPPVPPIEYDDIPDWIVGRYDVSAIDDINQKTSVWQVSLLKDEEDPTKCWFYDIDGMLHEKGFSATINKVSGFMCKDGKIRIPTNQNIGDDYWLKNYQSTDSVIVEISQTNNSMDISDAWGVSNKFTGEMLSRYTKSHFILTVQEDSIATPLINVDNSNRMSISCTTKDVVIKYTYTRNGEEPTKNSTTYSGTITLNKNGIVKAIAFKDGQSSAISTYHVTSFKVEQPDVHQDVNHVTFTCATDGAAIYYDWDGKTRQTGSLDIKKSGVIKVYAEKDDFIKSDVKEQSLVYTPDSISGSTPDVLVIANNEAGKLSTRISDAEKLSATRLTISGEINGTDIIFIREMFYHGKLTDLDIENATIVSGGDAYDTTINAVTKDKIVGTYLFENCSQMISIKLPSNSVKIEDHAFNGCKSLKRLDIPTSCVEVETMIVNSCDNLEEVNLSDAVHTFPGLAVYSNKNLMRINVSEGNQYYKSVDGVLFSKNGKILVRYPMGKEDVAYTIPYGVATIGQEAFDYAKIESITIPNTVMTIEPFAFENCKNIQSLIIPNSVTSIGESAFKYCDKLDNVTMSSEVSSIESFTFGYCKNLRKFYVGTKVSNIDKLAFYDCQSLQEFEVDENNNFFTAQSGVLYTEDMQELVKCPMALFSEEYIVPNGVKIIRAEAFATCTNIKRFYLPETLTTIGECAFENCEMSSIRIPQTVTSIGESAFNRCDNLESLVLPEGTNRIQNMTLHGCKSLTYVYIPANVKEFGMWAIADCPSLTMINSQITDIDKVTVNYDTYDAYYDAFEKIPSECTWRVPSGPATDIEKYARLYKAQPWWVSTWRIIVSEPESNPEVRKGDANNDGVVDVADIVYIVNYIMEKPAADFNFANADVDGDGIIDVADITLVVKIIMSSASARGEYASFECGSMLDVTASGNGQFTMSLADAQQYVASQFDVVVPSGASIDNVEARSEQHEVICDKIAPNRYRVMTYSLGNKAFNDFLNIKMNREYNDGITIENAMFVTTNGERYYSATAVSHTTGIDNVQKGATKRDVYTIDGRKTDGEKLSKGIYIINGKKHVVR